ncbi:MAG: IS110 family transposase [Clostridiaceae bacterium]|nr:IS110 family transposase [Clostridiaceae bacterium]
MKYKQNFKIMQVTDKTLVIGVDIAKKKHYARAFDWRGMELDKTISFKANSSGFADFMGWAKDVAKKNKKNKILVGIEPTGHYWFTFAQAVIVKEVMLVQVNPYHVKNTKELDDNTPSKSDRKDPKTIAMLVKDGRYQIPYMPKGKYAELRKANNIREEWLKKIWSIKNKVQRWLDTYFPELLEVFSSWEGKAAVKTLEEMATPAKIMKNSAKEIVSVWREEVKRAVGIKKAQKLLEAAAGSVGMKEGLEMAEYEMQLLMKEYKDIRQILDGIEEKLESIVNTIPGAENFLEIKGIGVKTVAGFFAEVGDIRRFTHPKQIIKLAGLNVRENSSGEYKGQTTISKRGRSRLRALLFRAILPLTAKNAEFNALHKYNIKEKENPLKKMQSLIALCGKLIRIVYTLVTKDVKYDPERLLKDIHRDEVPKAA